MAGKMIDITSADGKRFKGYLAVPAKGSGPGLVLIQEIFGVNREVRGAADLFAQEGFSVLAPDLFWRLEPGVELGYDQKDFEKGFGFYQKFDFDQAVADIGAAVKTLQAQPQFQGKVGVIGFCMGGLLTFLSAARLPVDAAVAFYGGGIDKHLGEAGKARCPMVLHFSEKDQYIPLQAVEAVRQAFAKRPDVSIYLYPEVDHGFYLPGRASHNWSAALLAHSRSLAFLRKVLWPAEKHV